MADGSKDPRGETSAPAADVTVIVPCYNVEAYVDQALTSAEQNDRARLQILAVNDGSTDATPQILAAHARRDRRVRVIDKPNGGYGAAINRALREACGTYVAILESDDWLEPHAYDDLFQLAQGFHLPTPPDVVRSAYWRVIGAGTPAEHRAHGYVYGRVRPSRQPFVLADAPQLIQFHPAVWSGLYRTDFLRARGIRMLEVPGGGWVDNPFVVDALAQAESIVYTDQAFYNYREDIAGTSTAARTAQLSFQRWNDRQDALDRLGVTDPGILRANYVVGMRFVAAALADGALGEKDVRDQAARLFGRMEPKLALGISECGWAVQAAYRELTGAAPTGPASKLAVRAGHLGHLVGEGVWSLRANGLGQTLSGVRLAFSRHAGEAEA